MPLTGNKYIRITDARCPCIFSLFKLYMSSICTDRFDMDIFVKPSLKYPEPPSVAHRHPLSSVTFSCLAHFEIGLPSLLDCGLHCRACVEPV